MSKARILVVDDSEIALEVVRMQLEDGPYEVATLRSALCLTRAIQERPPDLLLLDVKMPTLSGDKVAAILKRHRFSQGIPVVLYSDMERAHLQRLAAETGATGFILKTADAGELRDQVEGFLNRARRR